MGSREELVEAINSHGDIQEIKRLLLAAHKNEILKEDEKHFDVLHYAILADYIEVVHLVFLRGYFAEPHQPKTVPYLNLACKLGCTSIVSILLKERPHDISRKVHHACDKCTHLPGNMDGNIYIYFSFGDGSGRDPCYEENVDSSN